MDFEGVWPDDSHEPKRFFSYHTDEGIQQAVRSYFTPLSFRRIVVEDASRPAFQALLLRR